MIKAPVMKFLHVCHVRSLCQSFSFVFRLMRGWTLAQFFATWTQWSQRNLTVWHHLGWMLSAVGSRWLPNDPWRLHSLSRETPGTSPLRPSSRGQSDSFSFYSMESSGKNKSLVVQKNICTKQPILWGRTSSRLYPSTCKAWLVLVLTVLSWICL